MENSSKIVLLVDDEEIIREVGSKMLERMGYDVLTASSGAEALACYQEHRERIALVILDLILPDMSGGDAFDRIRGAANHRNGSVA